MDINRLLVDELDYEFDNEYRRIRTRLLHLHGRIERIQPEDKSQETRRNEIINRYLILLDDLETKFQTRKENLISLENLTVSGDVNETESTSQSNVSQTQVNALNTSHIACSPHVQFNLCNNRGFSNSDPTSMPITFDRRFPAFSSTLLFPHDSGHNTNFLPVNK
ncbi:hypothetical protein FQA39_LY18639 [Lamprigera yunnana]|nr:hypothetical protein FQA39_LY18639 [Lamprigera yunnana]